MREMPLQNEARREGDIPPREGERELIALPPEGLARTRGTAAKKIVRIDAPPQGCPNEGKLWGWVRGASTEHWQAQTWCVVANGTRQKEAGRSLKAQSPKSSPGRAKTS